MEHFYGRIEAVQETGIGVKFHLVGGMWEEWVYLDGYDLMRFLQDNFLPSDPDKSYQVYNGEQIYIILNEKGELKSWHLADHQVRRASIPDMISWATKFTKKMDRMEPAMEIWNKRWVKLEEEAKSFNTDGAKLLLWDELKECSDKIKEAIETYQKSLSSENSKSKS